MALTPAQLAAAVQNYGKFLGGGQKLAMDPGLSAPIAAPAPAQKPVAHTTAAQPAPVAPASEGIAQDADPSEPTTPGALVPVQNGQPTPPAELQPAPTPEQPQAPAQPSQPDSEPITEADLRRPTQGLVKSVNASDQANADVANQELALGEAKSEAAKAVGKVARAHADKVEEDTANFQKVFGDQNKKLEGIAADYRSLMDGANNTKIMYDRRTTGQKVMGIIAMALGGVGDAMALAGGHETHTLDKIHEGIQASIDRDVAMQREAIEDKRRAAAGKLTEFGLGMQMFGNTKDAAKFAEAARGEKYAALADEAAANSDSVIFKKAATLAAAKTRAQSEATHMELFNGLELQRQRTEAAIAGAQNRGSLITPELAYRIGQDAMNRDNAAAARQIPGLEPTRDLTQVTDQQYKTAVESKNTYDKLLTNLDAMEKLATADYSPLNGDPRTQYTKLETAQATFKALRESTVAMLTQASGSGVPGVEEAKRHFEGLPEPSSLSGISPLDRTAIYKMARENAMEQRRIGIETGGAYRMPGKGPTKPVIRHPGQRAAPGKAVAAPRAQAAPASPPTGLPKSADEW